MPTPSTSTTFRPINRLIGEAAEPPSVEARGITREGADPMTAQLPPVPNPEKVARDSRRAIRQAWPHRHTSFRALIVIRANVAMLRRLAPR